MYCSLLIARWSTQSRLATFLSSLFARRLVGLQTLWWFQLKDLSIDEMVAAWCFVCCQACRGLPVGFLLLRYSVLFTVESLSLLYLLFISWLICSMRWFIDKLGVFHANQTYTYLDPHLNKWWGWSPLNRFKPSSKIFFADRSKVVLLLWIIYVISVIFCYAFMHVCLLMPCGHLLGKGCPLGSPLLCLIVTWSISHWYPGSGVVLDCVDSWSLAYFLL